MRYIFGDYGQANQENKPTQNQIAQELQSVDEHRIQQQIHCPDY